MENDDFKVVRKKRKIKTDLPKEEKIEKEITEKNINSEEESKKEPVKLKKEEPKEEIKSEEFVKKENKKKGNNSLGFIILLGIILTLGYYSSFFENVFGDVVSQITSNFKKTQINYSEQQNEGIRLYNQAVQYGKDKEYEKAFNAYKKAAVDYEIAEAMGNLGYCYDNGQGCEKDEETGFYWTKKAAEKGLAFAQCNLGVDYENGLGCTKNEEEAFKWYKKSAEQDYLSGIVQLGVCYRDGIGVEPDQKEAFKLLKQASEKNYLVDTDKDKITQATAKRLLAMMYYNGKGCEKNLDKAKYWLKQSIDQGDDTGKEMLKILSDEDDDILNYEDNSSYTTLLIDDPVRLGGIKLGDNWNNVLSLYGSPENTYSYSPEGYPDSRCVYVYYKDYTFRINLNSNNYILDITSSGINGIKTPHGIQVGDSESTLINTYGNELNREGYNLYTLKDKGGFRGYPPELQFYIENGKISKIILTQPSI